GGAKPSAADAFAAFYELEALRRVRDHAFRSFDAMALPTVPTVYTVERVLADPITLNSRLGTYTNFVNLLDLCALSVPASMRRGRRPLRRPAGRARGGAPAPRRARPRFPCRSCAAARRHRHDAAAARGDIGACRR